MQNDTQNIDFSTIVNNRFYETDKMLAGKSPAHHLKKLLLFVPLIFTGIGIPIFIVIAFVVIKRSNAEANERREAMAEFAQKNGFTYEKIKFGIAKESERLFANELELPYANVTSVEHFDVMRGKLLGCDFSYSLSMICRDTKRDADMRETQRPAVLFVVDLPIRLPRIFLNSKINNISGLEPRTDNFVSSETHQLEGDFPNYYSVKIEKNEHIDMYVTLTPEVMDTLKRNNKYDVWLNGSQLVLITFGDYSRYFADAPEAFKVAEVVMREIDKVGRALR